MTIAEVLRSQGYRTGAFGKWHLGDRPEFLPPQHGFDEYFGIPYSNAMWEYHPRQDEFRFPPLPLLRGNKVTGRVKDMDDQSQVCRLFTELAVDILDRNADEPFFLNLPHAYVHHPRGARRKFIGETRDPENDAAGIGWEAV